MAKGKARIISNTQIFGILISILGLYGLLTNILDLSNFPSNLALEAIGSFILFGIGLYLFLKEL